MTEHVLTNIRRNTGIIVLDRPKALNSLSLEMVRAITAALLSWRDDTRVRTVVIRSTSEKAFCAGGDIRFFHGAGGRTPQGGSALLEDFFTEEYALNHLIHHYPKPYVALMDGIVMGGGMGIAQGGPGNHVRIVTERTRMAMPEVNIGLFPDVGGSYFLSRAPGQIGTYLGVTGEVIDAAGALYAGLADAYLPSSQLSALLENIISIDRDDIHQATLDFAAPFQNEVDPAGSALAAQRHAIDTHFACDTVPAIAASLAMEASPFAEKTRSLMNMRSPLMMCVTLAQLRRGATMSVADCLRMERTMVRRSFEQGEVLEGIRSVVIDKDNMPKWSPAKLQDVTPEMVARFFEPAWPAHAHPLRELS
jgi:enoyl-CoA hydratase/carnithine racemase